MLLPQFQIGDIVKLNILDHNGVAANPFGDIVKLNILDHNGVATQYSWWRGSEPSLLASEEPLVVIGVASVLLIGRTFLKMNALNEFPICIENEFVKILAGNLAADLVLLGKIGLTFGTASDLEMIQPITSWTGGRVYHDEARFCHEIFRHLNKAQLGFLVNLVTPDPML